MTLTVDIGNTRAKWALFDGERLLKEGLGLPLPKAEQTIVCATGEVSPEMRQALGPEAVDFATLMREGRLPIRIDYATPQTLGPDRVAAACGAWETTGGKACVVVDAGTCITIDYLDASGTYCGGAILPGLSMKFRALHTFTAKLPLLEMKSEEEECTAPVSGRTTEESMRAGVSAATRFAIEGFVSHYRKIDPMAEVLVTGGDAGRVALPGCRVEPELVMRGLNWVMEEQEKNDSKRNN